MASNALAGKKFKVAIIQMRPKPLDPDHNFSVATSHLRTAASQGASLAILPEYHLSGWEPDSPEFISIARKAHKYQKAYQDLAAELKINICAGTIVQTPPDDLPTDSISSDTTTTEPEAFNREDDKKPTLLNISPFISGQGELLGTYIKTNVWIPERAHLTSSVDWHKRSRSSQPQPASAKNPKDLKHAGVAHDEPYESSASKPHQVMETSLGKVGILVCWDLAFPEAFRSLVYQGVKIILIPTYWTAFDMKPEGLKINPDAEKLFLESTLVARAFENTCTVIFCNAGGPKEEGFLGLSGVYAPIAGRIEGSFTDGEEGMRIVEVDLGIADVAEDNYRVREDLEGETWHYGKY